VQELRQMLVGVTWESFLDDADKMSPTKSKAKIHGVTFYAKYGLHMQRPVLAVIASKHFISLIQVHRDAGRDNHIPITPNSRYLHLAQYLYPSDFAPNRLALLYRGGKAVETTDSVLRELDNGTEADQAHDVAQRQPSQVL
jgi:hypothetical protein